MQGRFPPATPLPLTPPPEYPGRPATTLEAHVADRDNPHSVTKAQVGLGNADDTSDADKPVSVAQAAAIAAERERAEAAEGLKADEYGEWVLKLGGVELEDDRLKWTPEGWVYQYLVGGSWVDGSYPKGAEDDLSIVWGEDEWTGQPSVLTATRKRVLRTGDALAADTPIPQVDGKLPVRPLPKYLHELSFDDPYKADAEAWYESLASDATGGACSAVRRGGKLYRNYDWPFDYAAEFVVRMSAAEGRHASVGVASLGAALTEDDVMSGVYTAKYRALPGMTLDGINDAGVVAEINVDGGPKTGWHGDAEDGGIHILAAVRWALDNGTGATQVAEWLAGHVIQPTGDMNFHFMVADATKTYVVENGEAHDVTNGTKVLTNYALFDAAHAGGGKERYDLLAGGADISAVHWTNAYMTGNAWHSDFESVEQHLAAIEQWAAQGADKESHRGKTTTGGEPWWQTVHTTEYDFAAKTMRIAVQETDEWFVFAAGAKAEIAWDDISDKPQSFTPSPHAASHGANGADAVTVAQSQVTGLGDALAAKADEFTAWSGAPVGYSIVEVETGSPDSCWAVADADGEICGRPKGGPDAVSVTWNKSDVVERVMDLAPFTAARKRVLRTGDAVASFGSVGGASATVVDGVADLSGLFERSGGSSSALRNSVLQASIDARIGVASGVVRHDSNGYYVEV